MGERRLGAARVAALGGASASLLVWLLAPLAPPSPLAEPQATASAAAEAESEANDVEARVGELERQVASLRCRSAAREALAAFTRAAQAQGDEASAGDTSLAPVIDQDDPTFELAVRGVMDRVHQQEDLARQTRRVDRARQLTLLLAEELQLSESQQQPVERILADQFARYRELRQAVRDAGSEGVVTPRQQREHQERVREQTERETERRLAEVLDQEQLELFRQLRAEENLKPGG